MDKTLYSKEYGAVLRVLQEAREEAGLTQEQLAMRLGESQSFVSKVERGERRLDHRAALIDGDRRGDAALGQLLLNQNRARNVLGSRGGGEHSQSKEDAQIVHDSSLDEE